MKPIRVLLTSVGRRVELVQAFKQAADNLNIALTIYGADLTNTAPALYFCDRKVKTPRISDPTYISELQSVCVREKIDCLIPTIDTDLLILSQRKDEFKALGTQVLISAEDKIRLCRDKRLTSSFFVECGLLAPMPVDAVEKYSSGFPAFIKPKDGSSSINAFKVDDQADLEARASQVFDYIIQPFVEGTEYTVDIFCDFEGNPIYITPRERIAVRSGEVLKTRICQDETIIAECQKIIDQFKPCGPLTVQLIRQIDTGKDYYIEINPRFGGGAPLSMKAGADSAETLLRLLSGETVDYNPAAATDGAVYSRYDQSVCTNNAAAPGNKPTIKAVIFDLDDTLYSEKDYVRSGFRAVSERLNDLVDHSFDKLWTAFEAGQPAIDIVLSEAGMPDLKDECVRIYRSHSPRIALYQGVHEMLEFLRNSGIRLGIITDGRPKGQRAKIEALGLTKLIDNIIITDELGGVEFRKPCDIAFRIMQRKLGIPYESMVYVADNPTKDFVAPSKLGIRSVWFKNSDGLYSGEPCSNSNIETRLIDKISEVQDVITKSGIIE